MATALAGVYDVGGADLDPSTALARDGGGSTLIRDPRFVLAATPGVVQRAGVVIDGRPIGAADRPEDLRGEFVMVAWDGATGRGLIARDRTGRRPLFVARRGRRLLFATEVRNLLALLPSTPSPDPDAIVRWLARAYTRGGATLFDGIAAVAPGTVLHLADGRVTTERYWRPAGSVVGDVRGAVAAAVDRALGDAQHPAAQLSGGLDSSGVAAIARKRLTSTYSIVYPGRPELDESDRIAAVRASLRVPGVDLAVEGGSALAAAQESLDAWELPPVSPNRWVLAHLYRRAAADGVDVLLGGDGGDELFGCAYYLVADRLRRLQLPGALRIARELPGMGDDPEPRWLVRALLVYGIRGALPRRPHELLRTWRGRSAGPDWLLGDAPDERWAWKEATGPRWRAHLTSVLTEDRLGISEQTTRDAALYGLSLAHPLRDPELIEHVLALPPELAFDATLDRPLFRQALKHDLPAAVLADTRKPVFNALLESTQAGADAAALDTLLGSPTTRLREYVDAGALRRLLDERGASRRLSDALDLWRIATLELWLRRQESVDAPEALTAQADRGHARVALHTPTVASTGS